MATYSAGNTAYDLGGFMVNTKAATIYAAQESSLFLGGSLIPLINVPAGSITAQLPLMGSVTAQKLTSASHAVDDFNVLGVGSTNKTVTANIYAARDVLRDLGAIDPMELGRVLGQAVTKAFDLDVLTTLATNLTASADVNTIDLDDIFDAVATIRGAGEYGPLIGIISPTQAAVLLKSITTASSGAYLAGGAFQTEALQNGFLGTIAGVRMFQSSYATAALTGVTGFKGLVMGADAARIAMFKNVDVEVQRRAAAVGNDIVASLHAGVGVVDANRGVRFIDA
jgi:hypothetical protein